MNPATDLSPDLNDDLIVNAYIYTPHLQSVEYLREFFIAKGAQVFINEKKVHKPNYFIVFGPDNFVKTFFSRELNIHCNILVITYEMSNGSVRELINKNIKIARLDSDKVSNEMVKEILSFYITSKKNFLDFSLPKPADTAVQIIKPKKEISTVSTQSTKPKDEQVSRAPSVINKNLYGIDNQKDKTRIAQTISEIYSEKEPNIKSGKLFRFNKRHKITYFFILLLAPVIWYLGSLSFSVLSLWLSLKQIEAGNPKLSVTLNNISRNFINQSEIAYEIIKIPAVLIKKEYLFDTQERYISIIKDAIDAGSTGIEAYSNSQVLVSTILLELSGEQKKDTANITAYAGLKTQLPFINDRLSLIIAQIDFVQKKQPNLFRNKIFKKYLGKLLDKIETIKNDINTIEKMVNLYSQAGGFENKKKYLVLFQNSMELRPTGGFIGSIGNIMMHEGSLNEFEIIDVYTLDGQLKGHIDPPIPVRKLLNQEHWYLRDVNWNPDFVKSAQNAAWIYQKEAEETPDGVIGVSLPFILDLLKITGPVQLVDYNDTITAENFFGKALFYVEGDFFPGSTQKKDFLGSLARALVYHLSDLEKDKYINIYRTIDKALLSHDIQFYFTDVYTQNMVKNNNWFQTPLPGEKQCRLHPEEDVCISDFASLNEANMSVSKSNYFVKRSRVNEIVFSPDGSVSEKIQISYQNNYEPQDEKGGSSYLVYTRVYLPADASGIKISFNGNVLDIADAVQTMEKKVPYAEMVSDDTSSSNSAKIIGTAFNIQPKSEGALEIEYNREVKIHPDESFRYEYFNAKQAGIPETPTVTIFRIPSVWKLTDYSRPVKLSLLANVNELEYNTLLMADSNMYLIFNE